MVDLYIWPISDAPVLPVYPPLRQAQLEATGDIPHRRQRYAVWKLLEYGLFQSLGLSMEQLEFSLDKRGRWSCRECFFSLSHSKNAVAVAISQAPVGIDIEALDRPLHPGFSEKILTPPEQAAFAALEEVQKQPYLLQKWCARESLFKWREAAGQLPPPRCHTGTVTVAGEAYCYAVTTKDSAEQLRYFYEKRDKL